MHAVCYPRHQQLLNKNSTHTRMHHQQGKECRARLAQRQRLGHFVSSSMDLAWLSILKWCVSALNAANPRTQTFSQGPEASFLRQVEQQPEAELLPQERIPSLCLVQGSTLCQVQMPHLQPGQSLAQFELASKPAATHTLVSRFAATLSMGQHDTG